MTKTKESIAAYNKEYFARPEIIERAKVRNAKYRARRAAYKLTEQGKAGEIKYRSSVKSKRLQTESRIKIRYGISYEDYQSMRNIQDNLCAICKDYMKTPHIDHDHETGKVRGLLCSKCNMGLGLFKDNKELLIKASEYINAL